MSWSFVTSTPTGPGKGNAFTLIELLVVIAIIAIVVGLLLPGLNRARHRAEGIACLNHLRQLQIAFQTYADDHRGYLSPSETWISDPQATRWYLRQDVGARPPQCSGPNKGNASSAPSRNRTRCVGGRRQG